MKLWVSKKEFDGRNSWSTATVKNKDDKDLKMYISIQFLREKEPQDDCEIEIKDGFLSCYKSKDGIKPKIVVMDYEELRKSQYGNEPKEETDPYKDFANEVTLDDEDLPF